MFERENPYGRLPGDPEPFDWEAFKQKCNQRHHDYFLRAFYAGKLDPLDEENLKLAIAREQIGEVAPLGAPIPENAGNN